MPQGGVYLLSEGRRHLYVGRAKDIKVRIRQQSRPAATERGAAFAFRLARQETGKLKATYKTGESRSQLIRDPVFRKAFEQAKARIRKMSVRFVEESDPIRQAVLEIYVATVLRTPHNDFDTH